MIFNMFCCSPISPGLDVPCPNERTVGSIHCKQHSSLKKASRKKYKKLEKEVEQLCLNIENNQVLDNLKVYSKISKALELRNEHTITFFLPQYRDSGHELFCFEQQKLIERITLKLQSQLQNCTITYLEQHPEKRLYGKEEKTQKGKRQKTESKTCKYSSPTEKYRLLSKKIKKANKIWKNIFIVAQQTKTILDLLCNQVVDMSKRKNI
jgi:hypothetical protein